VKGREQHTSVHAVEVQVLLKERVGALERGPPLVGAGLAKRYSARAPNWVTDHARACSAIASPRQRRNGGEFFHWSKGVVGEYLCEHGAHRCKA